MKGQRPFGTKCRASAARQPRMRGFRMSVGRSRSGAEVVTRVGYGTVGYLWVVNPLTPIGNWWRT